MVGVAATLAVACSAPEAAATTETEALTPERFGARGDGRTDDTGAFLALSDHLNANDGGIVRLRRGATYIVGRQTSGGSAYLTGEPVLYARDVSRVLIDMNGATLKFRDGMKFGTFDPRTGKPRNAPMPFVDHRAAAHIGYAIMARNVRDFSVRDGSIDGNSRGAILGGEWGDTGRQLKHYGVAVYGCDNVALDNVHVRNSCLDGFLCQYGDLMEGSPRKPFVMRRCSAGKVARNCVTVTGTNAALFEQCDFFGAGEAENIAAKTSFGSNPKSCFDVEAEGGLCRNIVIRDSRLIAGTHSNSCFVADSGDSSDILLENCELAGMIWTSKPRTVFKRCRIQGAFGRLAGGLPDSRDNSIIDGCHISDRSFAGHRQRPTLISGEGAGATTVSPIVVRNSTIDISYDSLNFRWTRLENVTVNVYADTDTLPGGRYLMFLHGAIVRGLRVNDRVAAAKAPAEPYYLKDAHTADIRDGEIVSPNGHINWTASSRAHGGYTGRFRRL